MGAQRQAYSVPALKGHSVSLRKTPLNSATGRVQKRSQSSQEWDILPGGEDKQRYLVGDVTLSLSLEGRGVGAEEMGEKGPLYRENYKPRLGKYSLASGMGVR